MQGLSLGPADLAAVVAREVLDSAGLATDDLGLIIFSTNSPDIFFPFDPFPVLPSLEPDGVNF